MNGPIIGKCRNDSYANSSRVFKMVVVFVVSTSMKCVLHGWVNFNSVLYTKEITLISALPCLARITN